jgi:hypothetical protein
LNPCDLGSQVCDFGQQYCNDTGQPDPAQQGANCGGSNVCLSGTCQTCPNGASCTPSTNPCHVGVVSCSSGYACNDTGAFGPNGVSCGSGEVCSGGSCLTGCWIAGQYVAPGAGNTCATCQPDVSTSSSSPVPDGTACGPNQACISGGCTAGCTIDGGFYPDGTVDPSNACLGCSLGLAADAWSPFAHFVAYPSGGLQPAQLLGTATAADLNGDGFPDLAFDYLSCGSFSCQSYYLDTIFNNGLASFTSSPASYSFAGSGVDGPESDGTMLAVPLRADGGNDLVVTYGLATGWSDYYDEQVGVFFNQGNGAFTVGPQLSVSTDLVGPLVAADLNGDGLNDLAVATRSYHSALNVLLNLGDGGFNVLTPQPITNGDAGVEDQALAVADLTGDGKPDLVASFDLGSAGSGVGVLVGAGDGTFTLGSLVTLANYASVDAVATADVNGDGLPDAVAVDSATHTLQVLLTQPDGGLSAPQVIPDELGQAQYSTSGMGVWPGDFNGDGRVDLLTTYDKQGRLFYGEPDGGLLPSNEFGLGYGGTHVTAVDFNRDGRLDLLVTGHYASINLLLNQCP